MLNPDELDESEQKVRRLASGLPATPGSSWCVATEEHGIRGSTTDAGAWGQLVATCSGFRVSIGITFRFVRPASFVEDQLSNRVNMQQRLAARRTALANLFSARAVL